MSIQLNIEVQEAQVVLAALAELPLKNSIDLWFKIKSQAEQQLAAQQQNPVEGASADGGDGAAA